MNHRDTPTRSESPSSLKYKRKRKNDSHSRYRDVKQNTSVSPLPVETNINDILMSASRIEFVQDDSVYSFIFYGTVSAPFCIDSVKFETFCMKISFVNKTTSVVTFTHTTTVEDEDVEKRVINEKVLEKEVTNQKKLYDSFVLSPFVPRVFAASVFTNKEFNDIISSLQQKQVFSANADKTMMSILRHLHANKSWNVHIFLMEYMDEKYKTLDERSFTMSLMGSETKTFDPTNIRTGYLHMAANIACAASSVGLILYDAHNRNGLSDSQGTDVRLIDVGDAFDLHNDDDTSKLQRMFNTMLSKISENSKELLPSLCSFFDVDEPSKLPERFYDNLRFSDFRTQVDVSIQDIHRTLIMIAFIDFMMNTPDRDSYSSRHSNCRCRYTMEIIYGKNSFINFNSFIINTKCRPRLSVDDFNQNLNIVKQIIMGIIKPESKKLIKRRSTCSILGGKHKKKYKYYHIKTKRYRRIIK